MNGYVSSAVASDIPVVGELERKASVVGGLDGDDIRAEVGPQEQTQRLDGVWSLGLPSRQAQLSELLVGLQHDHVWPKHHPSLLLLVVVDLDSSVVRDSEGDHFGLVTLGTRGSRASYKTTKKSILLQVVE